MLCVRRIFLIQEQGCRRTTGLGSSHTAPCGAAVPARPPTRCIKLRPAAISVNGPSEPEDRVRRSWYATPSYCYAKTHIKPYIISGLQVVLRPAMKCAVIWSNEFLILHTKLQNDTPPQSRKVHNAFGPGIFSRATARP